MLSRLSIRARITIGSVLVAAVLLGIGLAVVRFQVEGILSDANAVLAEGDLASFEKDILANPTEPVDDPGTGVLVFVRGTDGAEQVDTLPRFLRGTVAQQDAANEQFSVTHEGTTYVIVGRVVPTSAGDWGLWAARSEASSELALAALNGVLVIGGILLLAGFGIASWLLTSAALRPVARMRERAETLSAEPTDGDLPVGKARDELAALAMTLNDFLARVRASTAREKRMVSDAAHELRTPLAALRTQLELAHDDFGNAPALALQMTAAEASVERLSSLATNLLELTRLEAHETHGSSATGQLVDELMGSIDRARMLALATHADISFDLSGTDQELSYAVERQSFGRLADNLLSNAISAVGEGGTVSALLSQGDGSLTLEVKDNGPGMPDAFLPRAFERFTRPDDSRATSTGGSGLGLALVHAIASAAGGSAELRNTHPGLAVTVRLPKM